MRFYLNSTNGTMIGEQIVDIRGRSTFFAQIEWIPLIEGDYTIYVWIDPLNSVPEAYENNNIAFKPIHIRTKPDIRVRNEDIAFTDNHPNAGERITVMAMVRNMESLPTGVFVIRAYDGMWPNLIGTSTLSLNGHETQVVMFNWTAVYGNHVIHVWADSTFVVNELNETNNHGQKAIYVNGLPTLSHIGNREINEGSLLSIDVDASDPESQQLTYYTNAGSVLPSSFSFNNITGLFSWTPTYNDAGVYSVKFNVTDSAAWDSETITITVNNVGHGGKYLHYNIEGGMGE